MKQEKYPIENDDEFKLEDETLFKPHRNLKPEEIEKVDPKHIVDGKLIPVRIYGNGGDSQ